MTNPATQHLSSPRIGTPGPPGVSHIMRSVMIALVPGTLVYALFISPAVFAQIVLCCIGAVAAEALALRLRNRSITPILSDGSAILAAWLLALAIPPIAPWWIAISGGALAMLLGKHMFGGLGHNPFNPAMVAYAFLLISFPLQMTLWPISNAEAGDNYVSLLMTFKAIAGLDVHAGITAAANEWDAITRPTPLDRIKHGNEPQQDAYGTFALQGWEWVNLAWLAGGLWLLWRKIITWHIPLCFLLALGLSHGLYALIPGSSAVNPPLGPLTAIFSGSAMLGAFFIATDPVSAATTPVGRLIYAVGIGILTFVIRQFSSYPEGIAFAVLLMNCAAPLIDHYVTKKPNT